MSWFRGKQRLKAVENLLGQFLVIEVNISRIWSYLPKSEWLLTQAETDSSL